MNFWWTIFICTVFHRCLYFQSVQKFVEKKYEWYKNKYYAQRSFDGSFHVCSTCHNKLRKNNIPCQAIGNKMFIKVIPEQLSHWKRLERISVSQRILLKKVLIMHWKGEFAKIKGSICNVLIEASNICKVLPRPADSNGLILVKPKRHLKYRGHVILRSMRPTVV